MKTTAINSKTIDSHVDFNSYESRVSYEYSFTKQSNCNTKLLNAERKSLIYFNVVEKNNKTSTLRPKNEESKSIKLQAEYLYNKLEKEIFICGDLSSVDYEIEKILINKKIGYVLDVVNAMALRCYASDSEVAYSHFLNVLKNLTFHTNSGILKINILAALSHKSIAVKEAAIAIFEGWNYKDTEELSEIIGILRNIDLINIKWLDEYRNMVIIDLTEELKDFI